MTTTTIDVDAATRVRRNAMLRACKTLTKRPGAIGGSAEQILTEAVEQAHAEALLVRTMDDWHAEAIKEAAERAEVEQQLARYIEIPVALLRAGMIGTGGQISDIREVFYGGETRIAWTDGFGRMCGTTVDGWVSVTKASVTHKVRIRQVPEPLIGGCPTGNYAITAVCVGCGWASDSTSSSCMANTWAAEHEEANTRT